MKARITSIENTIARDPGGRNIFGLVVADQLRLAAQSLRLGRRVGIVSGFYNAQAGGGETDGPPGAKVIGEALGKLGIEVDYITDSLDAPLFRAMGIEPLTEVSDYLEHRSPTHLISVERIGRAADRRYYDMRGHEVTQTTEPLDELFIEASRRGVTTIGIGDGGNEIGMGKVFSDAMESIEHGRLIACTIPTDYCIAAGTSNWGAYGLAGALSVLEGRDLLPTADEAAGDIERAVEVGGAVDGITGEHTPTVDGLELAHSLRMLENIRRQIAPLPLPPSGACGEGLEVGILGYGQTGRATSKLLMRAGCGVRISDVSKVAVEDDCGFTGIETGGHNVEFLACCDLVVASPGVRADAPIRNDLHRLGIPVVSALEAAYHFCDRELVAVTGTIGKRSTVETIEAIFHRCARPVTIGGNKGRPLAKLLLDEELADPIVLAVSSFQLETVVRFRPHVAVILNISEAHLDRHRSIAEYARIKSRIFMNQHPDDVLVLFHDDQRVRSLARKHQGRAMFISAHQAVERGAWIEGGVAYVNLDGAVERIGSVQHRFPENILAAVVIARLYGLEPKAIGDAIAEHCSPTQ